MIKNLILWALTLCSGINRPRRFEGAQCHIISGCVRYYRRYCAPPPPPPPRALPKKLKGGQRRGIGF